MRKRHEIAFTLVELLVVISIIALLSAMVVGLSRHATTSSKRAHLSGQMHGIQVGIDSYHNDKGFYPPDNAFTNLVDRAATNQLFYELVGATYYDSTNTFVLPVKGIFITRAQYLAAFGREGIVNAVGGESKNFKTDIKDQEYAQLPNGVYALTVPYELLPGQKNTWRYISTGPTNNPASYDLWAEVKLGDKTMVVESKP